MCKISEEYSAKRGSGHAKSDKNPFKIDAKMMLEKKMQKYGKLNQIGAKMNQSGS